LKGTMKALVKETHGKGAKLKSVDIPRIGSHDTLVKVIATSICGTDLHIYNWDKWAASRMKPPVIFGHEMAGKVVEIGSEVEGVKVGDYVSLECHKVCGKCYQCRTGQAHVCKNYTILGVDFDGCFAEYVKVPETNLWKNQHNIKPEVASLQDPIGNAVLATLSVDITGKSVAIIGCGAIGLFSVGIAKVSGASRVYAIDINDYRLEIARKMGATSVINPNKVNLIEALQAETNMEGIDVVVEMSGKEKALQDGLKIVKNGGTVSLLGIPEDKVTIDLANDVVFKGISMIGVTGRQLFKTWYKTAGFLNGALDVTSVITHKMKLDDYEEAFRIMNSGECGKIVLYPC